ALLAAQRLELPAQPVRGDPARPPAAVDRTARRDDRDARELVQERPPARIARAQRMVEARVDLPHGAASAARPARGGCERPELGLDLVGVEAGVREAGLDGGAPEPGPTVDALAHCVLAEPAPACDRPDELGVEVVGEGLELL